MKRYLCIDGGGTYVKYAFINEDGSFLRQGKYETPRTDLDEFLAKIRELYLQDPDIAGIGFSMPGIIDIEAGVIKAGTIRCCTGIAFTDTVSRLCGNLPVSLENDGKAAAAAEMVSGALSDAESGVILTLGTGIGGTVFIDRKIVRGNRLFAGELSYCYRHNELLFDPADPIMDNDDRGARYASLCTPGGIVARYNQLSGKNLKAADCPQVFAGMREGNEHALHAVREAAKDLAMLIFNIQCIIDPDAFAIGGGLSEQEIFIDMVREAVKAYKPADLDLCPLPDIRTCRYRNDANLLGAMYRLKEKYDI